MDELCVSIICLCLLVVIALHLILHTVSRSKKLKEIIPSIPLSSSGHPGLFQQKKQDSNVNELGVSASSVKSSMSGSTASMTSAGSTASSDTGLHEGTQIFHVPYFSAQEVKDMEGIAELSSNTDISVKSSQESV